MASLKEIFTKAEHAADPIWDCGVVKLAQCPGENALAVVVRAGDIVTDGQRDALAAEVCRAYGIERLDIEIEYALPAVTPAAAELVRTHLMEKYPSAASSLREAELALDGGRMSLHLRESWQMTRVQHLERQWEQEASTLLQMPVQLDILAPEETESFEERRRAELSRLSAEMTSSAPAPHAKPKQPEQKRVFTKKYDPNAPRYKPGEKDEVLYGKPQARELTNLGEITLDSGRVAVRGEIFWQEPRKLNGRDKTVLAFELSDGTGSLRVSKVFDDEEAKELGGKVKPGTAVTVEGQIVWSKFENDIQLNPSAIVKAEKKRRRDNAPEKRVELHLHTTMSAMDGVCDIEQAVALAASMGHKAVAITDHGVVQAFPEAMKAAKANGVKILYGMEAYCVDDLDRARIVRGASDVPLDGEVVIFDLETTGLSAVGCEIIEIGALLVSNGRVRERFHSYVRPTRPIPQKITELTGIMDHTVRDAPSLAEALPAFLAFAGDRPLVAHNASFDMSFVKAGCQALGIDRVFCQIDTVEMARALLPELKNHKLNTIAKFFRLTFEHHRADEDTEVLAEIWFRLCALLRERSDAETVADINDVCERLHGGGGEMRSHHLIILVRNRTGLIDLYKLISDSFLKHYSKNPIIPMSALQRVRENLILGSACEAGQLFRAVLEARPWGELMKLADFFDFLEIQPIGNNSFMLREESVRDEKQLQDLNRTIIRLGDTLGKPVCATGDVHFLEPGDAVYREILMHGKGFADAQFQAPLYYRTTDEMLKEFAYLGDEKAHEVVIKNPNLIADLCEEIMPVLDGTYPPSIENSARDIEQLARTRVMELYGVDGKLPDIVAERLEQELTPIIAHGFDVMYITAQKLVKKSNDAGYLVGSRGSVGSSFVAFLTGITEVNALPPHYRCPHCRHSIFDVDPSYQTGVELPDLNCPVCGNAMVKDGYNILFATFLGFNADKAPDIDLNFSGEYQLQAHRDCIELFGAANVYKAGTIGTIKDKTAYGYVRKWCQDRGVSLGNAEMDRLTVGCTGVKRTTGQHPGGLIVVPKGRSIYEFTPVQHPADDPDSDIVTTHFDFHSIHDNLLKLDLLGHDVPTIIRKLQDLSGIGPQDIPLDDAETMRLFTDISPLGITTDDILEETGAAAVPEFGTKFVRGMLVETQPKTFDGLVRISGLSHGTNVWLNNAQDLVQAGTATLKDIICCRDDITIYLMRQGVVPKNAFTISEAVRKGKGLKPEQEEELRTHNVPDWYIASCKKIVYLFPRAHAVAYTMMSYRIAWFKVHRPKEFYAVYFGNRLESFEISTVAKGDAAVCKRYRDLRDGGDAGSAEETASDDGTTPGKRKRTAAEDDIMVTLEVCHECMKRGIRFSGIDIRRSDIRWFKIDGNTLIPPLMAVPGLGEAAAQSIVEQREKAPFISVEELGIRCGKVSKAHIDGLTQAGAFDTLPHSSQLDLFGTVSL